MLRWCQPTVRALDGRGNGTLSGIRLRSSSAVCKRMYRERTDRETRLVSTGNIAERPRTSPVQLATRGAFAFGPSLTTSRATINAWSSAIVDPGACEGASSIDHTAGPETILSCEFPSQGKPDDDPVARLSQILTLHNTGSTNRFPAPILMQLYTMIKTRSYFRRLTPKHLTQLLALLGSLSLPTPRAPCIYLSKGISHIEESIPQTYWQEVLEIAREKERQGCSLNGTDRYWIMRAQLIKVVSGEAGLQAEEPRLRALSKATEQYLRIWRHTSDPEIHLPYFDALFTLGSPGHITTLVRRLCNFLEITANPHSQFIDLLCRILLKNGNELSSEVKERILKMVSTRLEQFRSVSVPSQKRGLSSGNTSLRSSGRYGRSGLHISDLRSALAMAIFPYYSSKAAPENVRQWASEQAASTFSSSATIQARWDNLMLLAISKLPDVPAVGFLSDTNEQLDGSAVTWRTVFIMATLHNTLDTMSETSLFATQESIKNIVRPLWRMWTDGLDAGNEIVTRTIVSTFFFAIARIKDRPLRETCYRYSLKAGLFIDNRGTKADELQRRDLFLAYVLATVVCDQKTWPEIFATLTPLLSGKERRDELVESLVLHYVSHDVDTALGLYRFGRAHRVELSSHAIHALSMSLASPRTWDIALAFLHHPQLTRTQTEELFGSILRVFQVERRQRLDSALVETLSSLMWKLYAQKAPLKQLKYPIRFFFSIMIASGQPSKALKIVNAIHQTSPTFFTTRLFLRLARTLIRYRQLHLARSLLHLAPQLPKRAFEDLRRKLSYGLDRAGSASLARASYKTRIRHMGRRSIRESLGRIIAFKSRSPNLLRTLPVSQKIALNPSNAPAVKYAISVLVHAGRSHAAKKLFVRCHHLLDPVTKTSIGNTIIHGSLIHHDLRNGRLVRQVLRTKEALTESCDFVPDHTTVNIILKAMLRWHGVFDSSRLRVLFDGMVRGGYPVSSRWRQQHDVPFGTPMSTSQGFKVPSLSSTISFERHIRPLYKMFIKAFYLQHDTRAAKMVVGILKDEEDLAVRKREGREMRRREGLVRTRFLKAHRCKENEDNF